MKKAWSGRFAGRTAREVEEFTSSFPLDGALLPYDVLGSLAHARMLVRARLLAPSDARAIERGLREIHRASQRGELSLDPADEDVHMGVERLLVKLVGEPGKRLHTARSRNDQVATDLRLWAREAALSAADDALALHDVLARLGRRHADRALPGYTHLQRAQPVTLGHHLLAHAARLRRDVARFVAVFDACNRSPLGAGALAGTSLPIDRAYAARLLGFDGLVENSLDAVSDRDFLAGLCYASALHATHLSSLAEEIVLWTSAEFAFLELSDEVATGSSLMPQKKNPDVAELARAKAALATGDLAAVLSVLKALPLAYNRDLQAMKEPVFRSVADTRATARVLATALSSCRFDVGRMRQAAEDPLLAATDLAEELVRAGVPFREAHETVGRLVRLCVDSARSPRDLPKAELRRLHPALTPALVASLDAAALIRRHRSFGGPGTTRRGLAAARAGRAALASDVRRRWAKVASARRRLLGKP
ncbi:MAG TPA: argininosuccinate lyase [Candidatus Thermoplasmatota archaeon]|nr:argininosuccinate lyase [Candidatus Thermoplasmatota archaeon]